MRNRLLGLAVVLVALAVIVNALALQSADITNKLTISVTGSASALIAIKEAGVGGVDNDPDVTVSETNQQAVITLGSSLQPGSTYVFDPAFAIKNNSADTVDITLPTIPASGGVTVTFALSTEASPGTLTGLGTGAEARVKMTVTLAEGAGTTGLSNQSFVIGADR